jgi:hypothetical protein
MRVILQLKRRNGGNETTVGVWKLLSRGQRAEGKEQRAKSRGQRAEGKEQCSDVLPYALCDKCHDIVDKISAMTSLTIFEVSFSDL